MKSLWDFRIWDSETEVLVFGCTGESLDCRWLSAMCNKVGDDNFVTFGIRLLLRRVIMKDTVITEQCGHKRGNISLNFDVCIVTSIPKLISVIEGWYQITKSGQFHGLALSSLQIPLFLARYFRNMFRTDSCYKSQLFIELTEFAMYAVFVARRKALFTIRLQWFSDLSGRYDQDHVLNYSSQSIVTHRNYSLENIKNIQ